MPIDPTLKVKFHYDVVEGNFIVKVQGAMPFRMSRGTIEGPLGNHLASLVRDCQPPAKRLSPTDIDILSLEDLGL